MAGFCGNGFSIVLPADPRMRPVPLAEASGVGVESLFVCCAFGCSSPPVAGGSGEGDDTEKGNNFELLRVGVAQAMPPEADV